jgi:hypothetical protein
VALSTLSLSVCFLFLVRFGFFFFFFFCFLVCLSVFYSIEKVSSLILFTYFTTRRILVLVLFYGQNISHYSILASCCVLRGFLTSRLFF